MFEDWINTLEPVPEWHPLILPEDVYQDEISTSSPLQTPLVTPENMTPEEEHPGGLPVSSQNNNNNNMGASNDSSLSEGPSPSAEFGSSVSSPVNLAMQLPSQPGNRGGHQMVIDSANQVRRLSKYNVILVLVRFYRLWIR
jgi:hypothetical protein